MRGCPGGFMSHRFDPQTHRCKHCQRWQAGFAPKKVEAPRHECQICEAKFCVDADGNMVHHGYKRPGCGYIVGDCMAVGHKPYPATDALVIYRKVIEERIAETKKRLSTLRSPKLKGVVAYRQPRNYYNMPKHQRYEIAFTILRGAPASYDLRGEGHVSFEDRLKVVVAGVENELKWYQDDLKRVDRRIAKAQEMTAVQTPTETA